MLIASSIVFILSDLMSPHCAYRNSQKKSWVPYIVRQPPGPDNALGLVNYIFPNPHYVYLHDTNHRGLFDYKTRTFGSGCIRLNNPMDPAELLFEGQGDWNRMRLVEVISTGETTPVELDSPCES